MCMQNHQSILEQFKSYWFIFEANYLFVSKGLQPLKKMASIVDVNGFWPNFFTL